MAKAQQNQTFEKAAAGWFNGCNSVKNPWVMQDSQYRWGVNIMCRGGYAQTRPGYKMVLTLPEGNLQGMIIFKVTKNETDAVTGNYLVFAVDGFVYAIPFPLAQPTDWSSYKLSGIQFSNQASKIYWCAAEKSISTSTSTGTLQLSGTYSVLMMQDGVNQAAYWDGQTSAHLDEEAKQTPRGTWMAFSGLRLWVARGNSVIAGDLTDPLSFEERVTGDARGDFRFTGEVTGLANSIGDNRRGNLIVFTADNAEALLSSILDRSTWGSTANFQTTLFPDVGCVAGRSIVSHAGLLWWYSYGGLIAVDSAAAAFLTSQIHYRDVEMGQSKRNFAPDLSNVCAASFESFLMVSVPSGDILNAHTMVLDYSIADELGSESPPAWNGVWTGIRPVEWSTAKENGRKSLYAASVDYMNLGGSYNHVWEAFQPNRYDSYDQLDADNALVTQKNRIYCSFESKLLGDGMDMKQFKYGELHLTEVSGEVDLRVSYGGTKGGYHEILRQKLISTVNNDSGNATVNTLWNALGDFRSQGRHLRTEEADIDPPGSCPQLEAPYPGSVDRAFSLYVQWCGEMAIDSFRIIAAPYPEPSIGKCPADETDFNIISPNGYPYRVES